MALRNVFGSLALDSTLDAVRLRVIDCITQLTTIATKVSGTLAVSGPVTNSELRASAISVTGPATDAQLRATPLPVSGTVALDSTSLAALESTTATVSGTVGINNFPSTFPDTVAATKLQTIINELIGILTVSDTTLITSGSLTTVGDTVTLSLTAAYRSISFALSGTFSGANITYEMSNDGGTTWYGILVTSAISGTVFNAGVTGSISSGTNHHGALPPGVNRVRARLTAITTGTVAVGIAVGSLPLISALTVIPSGTQTVSAGLSSSAALADGASNPTAGMVGAPGLTYNGSTWDRQRGNTVAGVLDSSSARTASGNGTVLVNHNSTAVTFWIVVTAVSGTSPTLQVRVQESYDGGTTYTDIDTTNLQTASITATGTYRLRLGLGVTTTPNLSLGIPAPRHLRLVWALGGTSPSFTFATYSQLHA